MDTKHKISEGSRTIKRLYTMKEKTTKCNKYLQQEEEDLKIMGLRRLQARGT